MTVQAATDRNSRLRRTAALLAATALGSLLLGTTSAFADDLPTGGSATLQMPDGTSQTVASGTTVTISTPAVSQPLAPAAKPCQIVLTDRSRNVTTHGLVVTVRYALTSTCNTNQTFTAMVNGKTLATVAASTLRTNGRAFTYREPLRTGQYANAAHLADGTHTGSGLYVVHLTMQARL